MKTKEEFAALLHGREMGSETTPDLISEAKAWGLVYVFGHSDDCTEFRGCLHDETYSYDIGVTRTHISHVAHSGDHPMRIRPRWCTPDGPAWTYETNIPHATFDIMEDGEVFCRGIVFNISDLPE